MERLTNDDEDSIGRGDTSSLDAFADEGEATHVQRRCCTWQEVKQRPEIVLWYLGNLLSYLGFYMPFVNLVRVIIAQSNVNCSSGSYWIVDNRLYYEEIDLFHLN